MKNKIFHSRRLRQVISLWTQNRVWGRLVQSSVFLLLALLTSGCEPEQLYPQSLDYDLEIPKGFPPMIIPDDNALTSSRVELGKLLFHDPVLSRDYTISCESCHHQVNSFAEPRALSSGVGGRNGFRNAQALINLGWNHTFFRDGGVRTLELQVLAPIADHNEMDFTLREAVERLKDIPGYVQLARLAYGRPMDPFVITRAIAAYERTLISGNSPYDQYAFQGDSSALSPAEKRGMNLFYSPATSCSECHSGFNFTKFDFENNGLYTIFADTGRARVTLNPLDRGFFNVPTLRNIEVTGPYMHDGSVT
ncbi:MAG TPA: cytochrome-c peroxidase, partial [Bacteroidetes bacterium]|nr:cytochrome-c peroxidase [Bacteroidota bacterium]